MVDANEQKIRELVLKINAFRMSKSSDFMHLFELSGLPQDYFKGRTMKGYDLRACDLSSLNLEGTQFVECKTSSISGSLSQASADDEEVEHRADTDAQHLVLGRLAFVRELIRAIGLAERYGSTFTLMVIDFNEMAIIRDSYGHDAVEKALFRVAKIIEDDVRATDVVARLDGDEFGVILGQTDEQTGEKKAQELAKTISNTPLDLNGDLVAFQMTFGVYTFRNGDQVNGILNKIRISQGMDHPDETPSEADQAV